MKDGHQFRHLGHLHPASKDEANRSSNYQHPDEESVVPGDPCNRSGKGDGHAQHPVEVSAPGGFLVTQPSKGENKEND